MPTSDERRARPRVLYLAFYFPPTRASGVYRSRATANHLQAHGWDVTVITPQREFFIDAIQSYDPSLESTIDPGVRVERVHFSTHSWERNIRNFSWLRGHFPALWNKTNRWADHKLFPENYARWIPNVVRRGVALHREQPFDVILATGNPHSAFAAAWMLSRVTGVPYVLDYRDSWTLNLFDDAPAFPPESSNWKWERRVIDGASRVVFVNDALREWHARRYPEAADRMMVVQNGWEAELFPELAPPAGTDERPLVFGYLGTVTTRVPLEEFFAGWRLAIHDPALRDAQARLFGHLGFFPHSAQGIREKLPLDEGIGISYEGPVEKADVARVYESCDVLLLLIAGSKYVTSGKVYEYMASCRPIVSVHDPACAASEPLTGYPLWFPVPDLEPESVRDALVAAARAARAITPELTQACRAHALAYTRDAQLGPLREALCDLARR